MYTHIFALAWMFLSIFGCECTSHIVGLSYRAALH